MTASRNIIRQPRSRIVCGHLLISFLIGATMFLAQPHVLNGEDVVADKNTSNSRSGRLLETLPLSEAQQLEFVDRHNQLRAQENAANMNCLRYSAALAVKAELVTKSCLYDTGLAPEDGQNWYFASSNEPPKIDTVVNSWYNEKNEYIYDPLADGVCSTGKDCGHYTQLVWSDTSELGCSMSKCSSVEKFTNASGYLIACIYSPRGNWKSQLPFQLGEYCSACPNQRMQCHWDYKCCLSNNGSLPGLSKPNSPGTVNSSTSSVLKPPDVPLAVLEAAANISFPDEEIWIEGPGDSSLAVVDEFGVAIPSNRTSLRPRRTTRQVDFTSAPPDFYPVTTPPPGGTWPGQTYPIQGAFANPGEPASVLFPNPMGTQFGGPTVDDTVAPKPATTPASESVPQPLLPPPITVDTITATNPNNQTSAPAAIVPSQPNPDEPIAAQNMTSNTTVSVPIKDDEIANRTTVDETSSVITQLPPPNAAVLTGGGNDTIAVMPDSSAGLPAPSESSVSKPSSPTNITEVLQAGNDLIAQSETNGRPPSINNQNQTTVEETKPDAINAVGTANETIISPPLVEAPGPSTVPETFGKPINEAVPQPPLLPSDVKPIPLLPAGADTLSPPVPAGGPSDGAVAPSLPVEPAPAPPPAPSPVTEPGGQAVVGLPLKPQNELLPPPKDTDSSAEKPSIQVQPPETVTPDNSPATSAEKPTTDEIIQPISGGNATNVDIQPRPTESEKPEAKPYVNPAEATQPGTVVLENVIVVPAAKPIELPTPTFTFIPAKPVEPIVEPVIAPKPIPMPQQPQQLCADLNPRFCSMWQNIGGCARTSSYTTTQTCPVTCNVKCDTRRIVPLLNPVVSVPNSPGNAELSAQTQLPSCPDLLPKSVCAFWKNTGWCTLASRRAKARLVCPRTCDYPNACRENSSNGQPQLQQGPSYFGPPRTTMSTTTSTTSRPQAVFCAYVGRVGLCFLKAYCNMCRMVCLEKGKGGTC